MPELLLHIGTHKTGTTSIQRFCSQNRKRLRRQGIWYPPIDLGPFEKHYAHHALAHSIASPPDGDIGDDVRTFLERVARKAKSGEKVLLSAEPFYRHRLEAPDGLGAPGADGGDPLDDFGRYVRAVADALQSFDVTIMVSLRRQDDFAESLYAEQVLATGYEKSIHRFVEERTALLDYEARIGEWADVFGDVNVDVRLYESGATRTAVEQAFIGWIGLDWDERFDVKQRYNPTPSRPMIEFKRMLGTRGQPPAVHRVQRNWIEDLEARCAPDRLPDIGSSYLSTDERMSMMTRFDDGNTSLAKRLALGDRLFAGSPDGRDEFGEVDSVDCRPLTSAEFMMMSRELISMLAEREAVGP